MTKTELLNMLRPKGEYTRSELTLYSELSAGKIKAALVARDISLSMPLFNLIEDKDTSVGSEVEKRISGVTNKFFTHKAGEHFNESCEQIILAAMEAKLFGASVVELYLDEQGRFAYELVPREYLYFEGNKVMLKCKNILFEPKQPKFFVLRQKPVLSKVLWIVYAKHFVLSHYLKFTEFLGVPPLIGNASSSDEDVIGHIADAFKSLKSGSYAVLGPNDIVKVLEGRGSQSDFMEFVKYADAEIAKVLNGSVLSSNAGTSGSYAMSKTHQESRTEIIRADAKMATRICERLFGYINVPLGLSIQIELDRDLMQRARVLQILHGMGYDMSPEAMAHEFDFPAPVKNPNARNARGQSAKDPKAALPTAEHQNERNGLRNQSLNAKDVQEAILEDKRFLHALQKNEIQMLQTLQDIASECTSYEEVFEKLIEAYPDFPMEELESSMTKAIANNLLIGRIANV